MFRFLKWLMKLMKWFLLYVRVSVVFWDVSKLLRFLCIVKLFVSRVKDGFCISLVIYLFGKDSFFWSENNFL